MYICASFPPLLPFPGGASIVFIPSSDSYKIIIKSVLVCSGSYITYMDMSAEILSRSILGRYVFQKRKSSSGLVVQGKFL